MTPTPPVGASWVRRVPDENMWVMFSYDSIHVFVGTVLDTPPAPAP